MFASWYLHLVKKLEIQEVLLDVDCVGLSVIFPCGI